MSAAHPWWMSPGAGAGTGLLLALGATWRLEPIGLRHREAMAERGRRFIYALWHARLLGLTYSHRRRSVAVLISQHRDGELIARVLRRLGYETARGSTTRGGEEGVREMLRHAEAGRCLAVTPDGPRGPAERVKPGLVYLASRTGLPVLPTAAAGAREWTLDSWDRFRVPRPFSRLVFGYGEPIAVPPGVGDGGAEEWIDRIEQAIRAVTSEVDRRAREDT